MLIETKRHLVNTYRLSMELNHVKNLNCQHNMERKFCYWVEKEVKTLGKEKDLHSQCLPHKGSQP